MRRPALWLALLLLLPLLLISFPRQPNAAQPPMVGDFVGIPKMTPLRKDVKPFEYKDAKIPFYPPPGDKGNKGVNQMQLPLDAEESLKHFVHPEDFELQLFASDPQIKRPICMQWDERGRLWIAETVDYPNNIQKSGDGHDRIVILEDTKGTGKADKLTVFADKLSIPTSFSFCQGGVIVHQAPYTLFLRDTKGTGHADERKVLFTGWSTGDTHAGPSNLHYGLDNWYYGIVGYSGFNGTIGGEKHKFSQGFYRFKLPPPGTELTSKNITMEFLRNTNNNSWGVGFSEEGILFGSTANGNPSVYLPIPNRYYEAVRGWSSSVLGGIAGNAKMYPITDKVRQVDFHGHFTAAAGHALYTARTYPKYFWNRTAFVNEPTGHLTATFVLTRKGSDFVSKNSWNLAASDDEWTSPIMAEVGPDGNVWIIDWYNYIVQHNPTPAGFKTGKGNAYETELRDKTLGRIYRLVYKNAKKTPPLSLENASPQKLVPTLQHGNMLWRKHAQRLLVERGKTDVVPELIKLVGDNAVDEIGLNVGAIHALWTLHGLGALDGSDAAALTAAVTALKHPSAGVRRNAVQVLPHTKESAAAILKSGVLQDDDAQVRLMALLALADMPATPGAGDTILKAFLKEENYDDRWIPDAVTAAAAAHDLAFLKAVAMNSKLKPLKLQKVLSVVAEHYARGGPVESVGPLLEEFTIADSKIADTLVAALAKGWPKSAKVTLTDATEKALADLMPRLSAGSRGQLTKLAQQWGSKVFTKQAEKVIAALLATVGADKNSDDERITAARELIELQPRSDKVAGQLLDLLTPSISPKLAAGLLDALSDSQAPTLGPTLVDKLQTLTPNTRQAALALLLVQPDSTRAVLDAVEKGKVIWGDFTLEQKQALAAHPDKTIAARARDLLAKGGGLPSADRQKVIDQLLPLTKKSGDAALGKLVFKQHCTACHTHSGEGAKIGPDLTGMAVHTKEHLLTEIMDPSRSVEGNYRLYIIIKSDGKVLNGLLASETKTSLELYDTTGKKHVLQRDDVDKIVATSKSLMPDGFEKSLKNEEIVNLLEFLTQRGKYLPLPLDKVATVVSTQGMFYSKDALAERLIFDDWSPRTFAGVPFHLVDPKGDRVPNVILLYGPQGKIPPKMPKSVKLVCNAPAKAIHLLSGVSGWGYPATGKGSVSLKVRLHYADDQTEDHELLNGEHFADYIRRVDVPKSQFAFKLREQQIRYLAVQPKRNATIASIEFLSGFDTTAPVIMAVTVETK